MPNWVYNTLYISNNDVSTVVKQLNRPIVKNSKTLKYDEASSSWDTVNDVQHYSNPIFSFWNIVAPTDLEAYYSGEVIKPFPMQDNGKIDGAAFAAEFQRSIAEDNDWYHWNIRNWGTKWDVAVYDNSEYPDTTMEKYNDDEVTYRFNTAWAPPVEAITTLSLQHPDLVFELKYEEEQGWGGMVEIINGIITKSYDYNMD